MAGQEKRPITDASKGLPLAGLFYAQWPSVYAYKASHEADAAVDDVVVIWSCGV